MAMLKGGKGFGGSAVSIPITGINTEFGLHCVLSDGQLFHASEVVNQNIPIIPLAPNLVMFHQGSFFRTSGGKDKFVRFTYIP